MPCAAEAAAVAAPAESLSTRSGYYDVPKDEAAAAAAAGEEEEEERWRLEEEQAARAMEGMSVRQYAPKIGTMGEVRHD